jgi:hypothetical protein
MDEIQGRKFSVLIDESRDVSIKEQMTVILRFVVDNSCLYFYLYFYNYTFILTQMLCRFVNDEGKVVERFLGLQLVESCTASIERNFVGYAFKS